MKKCLILIALVLCGGLMEANAQRSVRPIEGEVAFAGVKASRNMIFDKSKPGCGIVGEIRYNFRNLPIDIGLQGRGQIWTRKSLSESEPEYKFAGEKLNYLSANALLVSDYNFRPSEAMTMFIGAGVGIAFFDENSSLTRTGYGTYSSDGRSTSFCLMPRIGTELFNRLRLTLFYQFEDKANECFGLQIGISIGGGHKR